MRLRIGFSLAVVGFAAASVLALAMPGSTAQSEQRKTPPPLKQPKAAPAREEKPAPPGTVNPAPPMTRVPTPPPTPMRAAERAKEPGSSPVEGDFAVDGAGAKVHVEPLFGDFYHLVSSAGWEGVGVLEGSVYRGILRHRGTTDAPDGAIDNLTIDWTNPEHPSAEFTYASLRKGQLVQHWSRIMEHAAAKPFDRPSPTEGTPQRPAFGEYVYYDELPEVVQKVAPMYPDQARTNRTEGTVMIQALVLADGTVGDTKVVQSVPGLDEAAVASVRQWRFKPAMSKGVPVAVWVAVPVKFSAH